MEEIKLALKSEKKFSILKTIILIIIIVIAGILIHDKFLVKKPKGKIITKSKLLKVLKISELNALQYYYDGIVTKTNDKGKIQYYFAYKGNVKLGINFDKIIVEEDEVNKKIIVYLPNLKITHSNIDETETDYIIINKKIKIEDIKTESFQLAKKHLENTVYSDKDFYYRAKENIKKIIKGLIEPVIKAKDAEYTLEIRDSVEDDETNEFFNFFVSDLIKRLIFDNNN